jgi:transcriptional regulator with XRE-family HTH domain
MNAWSPARAIRAAREAAGVSAADLAARLGPGLEWYNELERDDAAALATVSLAQLTVLATFLSTTPRALLSGSIAPGPDPANSFRALADALRAYGAANGVTVEALGNRVGYPLRDALEDPEDFWNLTVDQLKAASAVVGMDWVSLLSGGLPIMYQHLPQHLRHPE